MAKKTIELWDGYSVDVNEQLMDDFDFVSDLSDAQKNQDLKEMVTMYIALVGGQPTYDKIREYIEKQHGYFSQKEFIKIIEKINGVLPKDGNRAQRRSWKNSV